MVKRRDTLLLPLLGAAFGSTLPANALAATGPTAVLRAPKDGFIDSIEFKQGDVVPVGSIVFTMDSDEEQRLLARLDVAAQLVAIEAQTLSDEQVDRQRDLLKISDELVSNYASVNNKALSEWLSLSAAGGGTPEVLEDRVSSESTYWKLHAEAKKLNIASKTFEFTISQAKARNRIVSQQIQREITSVRGRISRLSMKSPLSGSLQTILPLGAWVLKGDTVAVLV